MSDPTPELAAEEERERYRRFISLLAGEALDALVSEQVHGAQEISCLAADDGRHDRALELIASEYARRRQAERYQRAVAAAFSSGG